MLRDIETNMTNANMNDTIIKCMYFSPHECLNPLVEDRYRT